MVIASIAARIVENHDHGGFPPAGGRTSSVIMKWPADQPAIS